MEAVAVTTKKRKEASARRDIVSVLLLIKGGWYEDGWAGEKDPVVAVVEKSRIAYCLGFAYLPRLWRWQSGCKLCPIPL
jgi:hypothetical protein